ncbi:MAG: hypothetical protein JWN48_3360 [Myxococcaceae bacterium]|nr:hypothetical protein [Myxococcaceae bacterium]
MSENRTLLGVAALLFALVASVSPAHAHKPSDSYLALDLRAQEPRGHWDIALRDLDRALRLDADGDGQLTWGELRSRERELAAQVFSQLALRRGAHACTLEPGALGLVEHSDGPYAHLPFSAACADARGALALDYEFFFALDPQHRAIVRIERGASEQTYVLGAQKRQLTLNEAVPGSAQSTLGLVGDGVRHILSGLDHVLFLLALLLPSVLRSTTEPRGRGAQIRSVLQDVFKVVTAFTIAHSLTLGLAALGLARMSASIIEPAIAASVVIAALDNLWPVFGPDRYKIAFVLGLLHGFGFSSALSDLGLHGADLLRGLFAFNGGVELGQLAIVLLFVPMAFLLRKQWAYRYLLLRGGSLAIAGLSLVWFVERVRGG